MRALVVVLVLLVAGCSSGIYKVPPKEYQQQVKTLGVVPLLVDGRSTVQHPEATEIFDLLRRAAAGRAAEVVSGLREKKGYFDVRLIDEPPRLLAEQLLVKAKFDELGQPRGYELNQAVLADICHDTVVDGVLLLTLEGAVHNEKRWSRGTTLESLTTDFNDIMATASVVAPDGRVLWEMNGGEAVTILPLQYPDFDEAFYNHTDAVKVKFIGFSGLEKTLLPLAEKGKPTRSPQIGEWLKKVTAALSPSLFR